MKKIFFSIIILATFLTNVATAQFKPGKISGIEKPQLNCCLLSMEPIKFLPITGKTDYYTNLDFSVKINFGGQPLAIGSDTKVYLVFKSGDAVLSREDISNGVSKTCPLRVYQYGCEAFFYTKKGYKPLYSDPIKACIEVVGPKTNLCYPLNCVISEQWLFC